MLKHKTKTSSDLHFHRDFSDQPSAVSGCGGLGAAALIKVIIIPLTVMFPN